MLIDIDKIVVGDRIRKDFGDIRELAEDIGENGLINPPTVNKEYVLLAGERRLRACKSLGWTQIEVHMLDTKDEAHDLAVEMSENNMRRNFTGSELAEGIRRQMAIESEKAKERSGVRTDLRQTFATGESGRARDKAAEQFGISGEQARKTLYVADNANLLDPADFADWDEGKLSTNKAYQRIRAAKEQAERERDKARADAATARKVGETLKQQRDEARDEIAALEKQNDELYEQANAAKEPQVIERVVESDAARKRISDLEHERDLYLSDVQRLRRRNEDMRRELDKAKDMLGMDKTLQDVRKDVQYLTSATNQYVRHYGGLTWTAASLEQVDAQSLADLRTAAINLATFANALVASLENFNG